MIGEAHAAFVRERQRVELHLPGLRVVQRDAGVIVLNDLAQRLRDLAEHARIVELGDEQVVHVEQQANAIALGREGRTERFEPLELHRMFDRQRHLPGDLLHQRDCIRVVVDGVAAAENEHPKSYPGRRQRHAAHDPKPKVAKRRHHAGEWLLGVEVDHHGVLRSENDAGRTEVHRRFPHRQWQLRMDQRDAHHVAFLVMEHQAQMIERHGVTERCRQLPEEVVQCRKASGVHGKAQQRLVQGQRISGYRLLFRHEETSSHGRSPCRRSQAPSSSAEIVAVRHPLTSFLLLFQALLDGPVRALLGVPRRELPAERPFHWSPHQRKSVEPCSTISTPSSGKPIRVRFSFRSSARRPSACSATPWADGSRSRTSGST